MSTTKYILTIIFGISFLIANAQAPSHLRIVNKIHLDGDEKWDYLRSDDINNRLYVSQGSVVHVIDESKGLEVGKIAGLAGVHGIAIDPTSNKGFISCGKDSSVTVFNTTTLQIIAKITVTGKGPDAIVFDPFSKNVFVFNGKSNNASVIDAQTNNIVTTIKLEGKPEFSVSDEKGKVYVNLEDKSSVAVINTATFKVENVWSISPGEEPTGLAIDNKNHCLFSVCKNKLMIITDTEKGKVLGQLPIGEKSDGSAFDKGLNYTYSSNGDKTMSLIMRGSDGKWNVTENFPTQTGARTIAVNSISHHIYLSAADFDIPSDGQKPKIIPGSFVVLDIVAQ